VCHFHPSLTLKILASAFSSGKGFNNSNHEI
jgi:hypothetical protein